VYVVSVRPFGSFASEPGGWPGGKWMGSPELARVLRNSAGRTIVLISLFFMIAAVPVLFGQSSPATMTSPASGSVLPGSSVTFTWTTGTGVSAYELYLGSTGGASNLYNSGSITDTSVTVNGLPMNGVNIYATLYSKINGAWVPTVYVYTEAGTIVLAMMTSPAPGSTLAGSSATFSWTAGTGPASYTLYVGTAIGASNIYNSGALTATSASVTGLPTTGAKLYVTLFSQINGAWKPVSYTYTQAGPPVPATLLSPAAGSTLPGTSATFTWSAGTLVDAYSLTLGTTGAGSSNLYNSGPITTTSVTVTALPLSGATVYATLSSQIGGVWQSQNYLYTEATPTPAAMTSPAAGSVLAGSSVTFSWSAGIGTTAYDLYLGTGGAGTSNIYNSGSITGTSVTVTGLPMNGVNLYATLYSKINGAWVPAAYVYTEAGTMVLAMMTSPAPGSTLAGSSVNFTWTAGMGPTAYTLYVGTAVGASNIFKSGTLTATSAAVTGLPTTAALLYVTLFSQINGAWKPVSYTYTQAGPPVPATLLSPAAGSTLPGTSATFTWSAGTLVDAYSLTLGTTGAGSSNLYNSGPITTTSVTVTALPLSGATVYATLSSQIGGVWQSQNYLYTEATPTPAAMTSPAPGSVLAGSSVTFTWTAGSQVTAYSLTLGTTGANSSNLYNSGSITATSVTVTGLPALSATVYATLSSQIEGVWQATSYTFTEAAPTPAAITSPAAGSVLPGSSVTFTWSAGSGPTAYDLYLGTAPGLSNIYNSGSFTATSVTASGLPTNGVNLYATLYSKINGLWVPASYVYTEAGTIVLAMMTSPGPGSILPGPTVTFSWSAGTGPTAYTLYVGTTSGASNVFNSGTLASTSAAVGGLPTTGVALYVTLFSQINGAWKPVSYTYTASGASGEPTPTSLSCTKSSMTGAGTDSCTVTLNTAAGSAGVDVLLSSNNSAVTVPYLVTVPANSSSVGFSANVSAVTTSQPVILTASSDNVSKTFTLQLNAPVPTLTLSSTSIGFGNVILSSPATQSLTLTSTGTGAVTISSAVLTGASSFTMPGATFPLTLNPTQAVMLDIQFLPTTVGGASGQLTISSNSSTGSPAIVTLSGSGITGTYQVELSWNAPTGSSDPIAGYYVFRATGTGGYSQLNSVADTQTAYVDTTVISGTTYNYYVETVDTSNLTSVPSTPSTISIP